MRKFGMMLSICGALLCSVLAGCGGGKEEGPSLDAQVKQAMAITSGEARTTKLIAVAAKQQAAGDNSGASASLGAAAEAAKSVEKPAARVRSLCQVVTALQGAGESKSLLKAASKAVDETTDPSEKVGAIARLAVAYGLQMKDLEIAKLHLKNAEEQAATVEAPDLKALALLDLAAAHEQLANAEHANTLILQTMEIAAGIDNERKKSETLASAGVTLNKMKKTDESKKAFDEAAAEAGKIAEPLEQSYAYLEVAKKLIAAGQKQTAAKLLDQAYTKAQKVDASIRGSLIEAIDAARAKT